MTYEQLVRFIAKTGRDQYTELHRQYLNNIPRCNEYVQLPDGSVHLVLAVTHILSDGSIDVLLRK